MPPAYEPEGNSAAGSDARSVAPGTSATRPGETLRLPGLSENRQKTQPRGGDVMKWSYAALECCIARGHIATPNAPHRMPLPLPAAACPCRGASQPALSHRTRTLRPQRLRQRAYHRLVRRRSSVTAAAACLRWHCSAAVVSSHGAHHYLHGSRPRRANARGRIGTSA
eukprot:scaffold28876_cov72-Phaeocystis_antarctica.AAC.3